MSGLVQPRSGASMIDATSAPRPSAGEQEAADVQPRRGGVARLGHEEAPGQQRGGDERQVDEEHEAPVAVLDEPAAGHGADHDAEAADGGPDPDRLAALVRGEHGGEDGERRRHDERAADAHQRAGQDEHVRRAGERREARAEAEDEQAEGERLLAAEAVAERAGGEQGGGEDEHVGVDDPLQLRCTRVEVLLQRGERDVEDRVVEPDHEQGEAEDDQRPPAARIGDGGGEGDIGGPRGERGFSKRDGIVSIGVARA